METYLWGPLMWLLIWELVRVVDGDVSSDCFAGSSWAFPYQTSNGSHGPIVQKRKGHGKIRTSAILVLAVLRFVLPCKICRGHYVENLRVLPPWHSRDLVEWAWLVKSRVNESQGRNSSLTVTQFRTKLAIQSVLLSPAQWWDLALILAHNYPKQGQEQQDPEHAYKCNFYCLFFYHVGVVMDHIPHLRNLFPVSGILRRSNNAPLKATLSSCGGGDPTVSVVSDIQSRAWDDDMDAIRWVLKHKRIWEENAGLSSAEKEANLVAEQRLLSIMDNEPVS